MATRAMSAMLVGFLAALVSLAAQQATPTFRATTHLVRVDAVVVDANGAPVLGLTPADFTLLDRGQPQKIATFEEVHHPQVGTKLAGHQDVASNVADNRSQLLVLVLDDFHIRKEWTEHAREIVEDFVRDLDDDTMIALLSTTGKYNVEVTSDRQRILDTLEHFSGHELPLAYFAQGSSTQSLVQPPRSTAPGLSADEAARAHISTTPRRIPALVSSVGGCSGSLEGVHQDSLTLFKLLENASAILGSEHARHKALGWISTGESFATEGLNYAIETMRRKGVATYAIDPVGTAHVIPGGVYHSSGCSTPWDVVADNKRASLARTARGSGGEAIINTDDFAGGVRKIVTDFGSYYTLGFYPDDQTTPGDRALEVTVAGAGVDVRARPSYSLADVTPSTPERALDQMASGLVPKGDLPMRFYAAALPNAANGGRVFAMIEVTAPPAPTDASPTDRLDRLPYSIMAVDLASGGIVARITNEASIRLWSYSETAASRNRSVFVLRTGFALPPGHYQLRASAASERTGAAGSVFRTLDVPDYRADQLSISDLLVGDSRTPSADSTNAIAAGIMRSLPLSPTLARTFRAGDAIHLYAEVTSKHPKEVANAVISLIDPDAHEVWHDSRPLSGADHLALDVTMPAPAVAAGPYALRATVSDGVHTVTRDVAIKIENFAHQELGRRAP
jgi:VWFA-related protein